MDAEAQRATIVETLRRTLSLSLLDPGDDWSVAAERLSLALAGRVHRDLFDKPMPDVTHSRIQKQVEAMLGQTDRTRTDYSAQASLIANALASYVIETVLDAGTGPGWVKEWVTVGDDKVRESHRRAALEGPVPADQPFNVGGHEMFGPHDLSAPIEEWANCRCHSRYRPAQEGEPMVAAANPDGFVIVGLPAADDPVNAASSEPHPHVTLVYMSVDFLEQAKQILAGESAQWEPVTVTAGEVGTLGEDGATVLHLDPGVLRDVRSQLVGYEPIEQGRDAVEQFPEWTPHLTLGYPENPAPDAEVPDTIVIDRLAIMVDNETLDSEYALGEAMTAAATEPEVDEVEIDPADIPYDWEEIPLYGALAPEEIPTGDKRKFLHESLLWVEPPLSLRWQERDDEGHKGSVVTGRMDRIWREDGLIKWEGRASMNDHADEMVAQVANGELRGVSVDLDDTEVEFHDVNGQALSADDQPTEQPIMAVSRGRIRSAIACAIPAFIEAFIAIGTWADHESGTDKSGDAPEVTEEALAASAADVAEFAKIDEGSWDGSASRYTDEEWFRATLIHLNGDSRVKADNKLPVRTPTGTLSRAGVHAAASRIGSVDAPPAKISAAKSALRGLYGTLGEDVPDSLKASGGRILTFGPTSNPTTQDGPGWLTHPVDTDRLRDYWVRGAGAAKIGWGMPGDFNRCRVLLAPYIKQRFLAGYCANRHKDALGFWPGEHRGGKLAASAAAAQAEHPDKVAPMFTLVSEPEPLVAAGNEILLRPPSWWFERPPEFEHITEAAPLVISEEGRFYAHAAAWDTCHLAYRECITAPHSPSNYAWYRLGEKLTDKGSVPVGVVTIGTGHASLSLDAFNAAAHYDNTGTVVAQVACGEDEFGIWVAGCVAPSATPEQIDDLRASKLSGDWRPIGGESEMIRVLAVNTPGFPIPRMSLVASADGTEERGALVAAGVVESSDERIQRLVASAVEETLAQRDRKEAMASFRSRVAARRREQIAAYAARKD